MNILITSIGNKVNLIKYFRRALFNEGGGYLFACDTNPLINARRFVDTFESCPPSKDARFEPWLTAFVQQYQISLIIPSRDDDLIALAALKARFKEQFNCRVLVPDMSTLAVCSDKAVFGKWCQDNDFLVPEAFQIAEVTKDSLPIFIKPKVASGSQGAYLVETWRDWESIREDLDDRHMIQEFIDAPEYTIDLFVGIGGDIVSVVPRHRRATLHGESIHSQVELDDELIEQAKRLAKALALEGPNTIQCFKLKKQVVFVEVNPRFGGGFTLGVEAGADSPRYLIREAKGLKPVDQPHEVKDKLEMMRIQKDLIFSMQGTKIFCFDLDGTICSENCAYEDAEPMPFVVRKINALYEAGHTIVIATARGAASQRCWRELIEKQLETWGVKYHRLITDKPFADYYIDNKALDILEFF